MYMCCRLILVWAGLVKVMMTLCIADEGNRKVNMCQFGCVYDATTFGYVSELTDR